MSALSERPVSLDALARQVRAARGVAHKTDIAHVVRQLGMTDWSDENVAHAMAVPVGDDCAAIRQSDREEDGFLLLAIEGFVSDFVRAEPRFAGYCGVMVNVSDIYAMGGRPIAVVDALWSRSGDAADPLLAGLAHAAQVYGVPIVGGHSNRRADSEQLAVAILGRAQRLLSSFDAQPGQHLVAAIDLRGRFHDPFPYWDASSGAPAERLRADLEVLPRLAENDLCRAAKDISMAGIVGTALMFAECSRVGVCIDVAALPMPPGIDTARWIDIFPSYGFLLAVDDICLPAVLHAFAERDISANALGRFDDTRRVRLRNGASSCAEATVWDFNESPLMGCAPNDLPVQI